MAESKAEKLAAARRMLKEYRRTKETSPSATPTYSSEQNILDSEKQREKPLLSDFFHRDISNGNGPPRHMEQCDDGSGNVEQQNITSIFNYNSMAQQGPFEAGQHFFDNVSDTRTSGSTCESPETSVSGLVVEQRDVPELLPANNFKNHEGHVQVGQQYKELENALLQEQSKSSKLQLQLLDYATRINKLEGELKKEWEHREEEMAMRGRTIEILVSEKSELQKLIDDLQQEITRKKEEGDELIARLSTSRGKVAKLEKEVKDLGEAREQHSVMLRKLEVSLSEGNALVNKYKSQLDENEADKKELKRMIEVGAEEIVALNEKLKMLEGQLSMAQIKLQQLGGIELSNLNEISDGNLAVELKRLRVSLEDEKKIRERDAHQYQEYIAQIDGQLRETDAKLEKALTDREQLKLREESLVAHLAETERRLQRGGEIIKENENSEADASFMLKEELDVSLQKISDLEASLKAKEEEFQSALIELHRRREEVIDLTGRLEASIPEAKLLQAAMESDKLAASRAIDQNNSLKKQLSEMQAALTTMSNGKLELMEELEKEQAASAQLKKQLMVYQHTTREEGTQLGQGILVDGCSQTTYHDIGIVEEHPPVTVEAMTMLEDKFRKTMDQVAGLLEEKQRLEHLVTQLQGETDTIGEYVALYQSQRSLLERRANEREEEVMSICKEKEILREKLDTISKLVPTLLPKEGEDGTVEKVMSLIGEIGTSSLVTKNINFYPCACCSGKLLTV